MTILSHLTRCRRAVSVLAAVGLAAGLGLLPTLEASAATSVDPNQQGSLTIHKYWLSNGGPDLPSDGSDLQGSVPGLIGIRDVTYLLQEVQTSQGQGLDLSTNQAWQEVGDLSQKFTAAPEASTLTNDGYKLEAVGQNKTDGLGIVKFTNLPIGLYLVTELHTPGNVRRSGPFLVTIPMTKHNGSGNDSWLYDVHVFPKSLIRSDHIHPMDSSQTVIGGRVMWKVRADFDPGPIDRFVVKDTFDPRVTVGRDSVALVQPDGLDWKRLLPTRNYTRTVTTAPNGDTELTIDFEPGKMAQDLEQLVNQRPGIILVWEIIASTDAVGDGIIPNEALVYPNNASTSLQPGDPNGPIKVRGETRYGGVDVETTDGVGAVLPGAEFAVVATKAGDPAPQDASKALKVPLAQAGTNASEVNGHTQWVSDSTGHLAINGLRYSCFAESQSIPNCPASGQSDTADGTGSIQYWLFETDAPSGHEPLAQPVKFLVTGIPGARGTDLTVANSRQSSSFRLPETGGTGTVWFSLAGLVLAGVAVMAVVSQRRRANAHSRT